MGLDGFAQSVASNRSMVFNATFLTTLLDGWMDGWMLGWMDGWTDRQMDEWTDRRMGGWAHGGCVAPAPPARAAQCSRGRSAHAASAARLDVRTPTAARRRAARRPMRAPAVAEPPGNAGVGEAGAAHPPPPLPPQVGAQSAPAHTSAAGRPLPAARARVAASSAAARCGRYTRFWR
eukprot:331392-Chlamydomonas_euryale.AAC.17